MRVAKSVTFYMTQIPLLQSKFAGRRCELVNLNNRRDLIGQTCVVEKYIARKDRYKITTEHTNESFLVGPNNLRRRDRTPEDPGYYIAFEDASVCLRQKSREYIYIPKSP